MNALVLMPGRQDLDYSFFPAGWDTPPLHGTVAHYRGRASALVQVVERLRALEVPGSECAHVQLVAVRVPFGGASFKQHALATPEVLRVLEDVVPRAPLHLPAILNLVRSIPAVLGGIPCALLFETAFFADLPEREHLYALDPDGMPIPDLRRYGYHGLFHEAACAEAHVEHRGTASAPRERLLSVCLEPQPEIAAVIGRRAVMVSSGFTPLEGLPGHTTCGEIDPGIIIMLSRKLRWGPEQINTVLTRQSGLSGLAGRPTTVEEVLTSGSSEAALARRVLKYRLLLTSGAAVAAMGGLDAIVFSGRYAQLGHHLGSWLIRRLSLTGQAGST
ncbi:MAG: hypothetical protein JXB13_21025, partial [Phycisphaerae bacterium]|nr:hypothetical protein [Phycisphaerae bacterium]